MVDPEKRKKLEEIRLKRKLLQEQLHQSDMRKIPTTKSVEQEAKEALEQASRMVGNIRQDELINKTQDNIMRMIQSKKAEGLSTTKFSELFPAYKPEVYDEGTQWSNLKKEDDDEDSEIEEKEQINEKPKVTLVVKKNKQVINEETDDENKEYTVTLEEDAKNYIESHKEEIDEFLRPKRKYIQRAINENDIYNMFLNDDYEYPNTLSDSNNLLHPIYEFYDSSCENRTILALEWSIKYPELLLSCYSKRIDNLAFQENGLIHIWNLANRKEPEFKFKNQAEITSAIFHPYNPRLIIGGTETGIVMIWDTRGKETPIYKTPLGVGSGNTSKSHTSDITCLGVVGSINSSHIVSLSNGIICLWSLSNMSSPIKKLELRSSFGKEKDLNELNVLSMGMQQNDTNNILLGCDDYSIYQLSLNSESSINSIINCFKSHQGPVYSIDFHPNDFPHIFATSSADWTTKIWSKQIPKKPLISLEQSNNYVYSCKWSPVHPSILAMSDGNGYLDIMDLNKDIEIPKVHCKLGTNAINKICWSEDGKRITTGDSIGKIQLFGVDKQLYIYNNEDTKKFENVIGQKK